MNHDEKYCAWKNRPGRADVSPEFSAAVMRRIHQQTERQRPASHRWLDSIVNFQHWRLAQCILLAVGVMVGLGRYWLMFSVILEP